MVWASPETSEDATPGVDSVKVKPLKRRCSRAGLSRYYSSKSQSFSSLDKVQCTPFGTSALALAKRPSSFDLRRGSVGPDRGMSRASRLGPADDGCISMTHEEEAEEQEDEHDGSAGECPQCPCNDTIFADPINAFDSPDCSPSASPLQLHDSCSLAAAAAAAAAAGPFASLQQQHQQFLTSEYLGQLSALLPFQQTYCCAGGTMDRSRSGSSCCSSGHGGCSGGVASSLSTCDSGSTSTGAFWQPPTEPQFAAAAFLPPTCCTGSRPLQCSLSLAYYPSTTTTAMTTLDGTAPWLRQSRCISNDWGRDGEGRFAGAGSSLGELSTSGCSGSRSRNCMSAGGCLLGVGGPAAASQTAPGVRGATRGSAGPAGSASMPTGASPCAAAAAAATTAAAAATMAVLSVASGAAQVRRLGLSGRHRLRLSVAGRGPHHRGKPSWGSTEDLIAALTLGDKRQPLQLLPRRAGLEQPHGRTAAAGGVGFGSCGGSGTGSGAGAGSEPSAPLLGRRSQPAEQQRQQQGLPQHPAGGCVAHHRACPSDSGCGPGVTAAQGSQPLAALPGPHPHLPASMLPGPSEACWGGQRPPQAASGCAGSGMSMDDDCGSATAVAAAAGRGAAAGGCSWGPSSYDGPHSLHQHQQQSCWPYGSAPSPSLHGFLAGGC